jgi:hypothetical protein
MQVLVLDPVLIPTSVDVVIGDNVYELNFRVEPEEMQEMPKPLEMVDDNDEFHKKEEGEGGSDQGDFMQEDKSLDSEQGKKFSAQTHGTGDGNKRKKMMQLPDVDVSNCVEEVLQQNNMSIDVYIDETETYNEDELMGEFDEDGKGEELASPEATRLRELAAILEVETPLRKSKRRASFGDENSLERAARIKATRNLDFKKDKGNSNTSHASFIHFSDEHVVGNLSAVGVSLGNNDNLISSSISHIKEIETGRLEGVVHRDMVSDIFDKEEKEDWKMRN